MRNCRLFRLLGSVSVAFAIWCVEADPESLYIAGIIPPMDLTRCEWDPSIDVTYMFGSLDVMLRGEYWAVVKVVNRLKSTGTYLGADPNYITLKTYDAEVDPMEYYVGGSPETLSFEIPAIEGPVGGGDYIPAEGGMAAVATVAVRLTPDDSITIKDALGAADRPATSEYAVGTAKFRLRLKGNTAGGVDIDSGWYEFPLKICYGCLVDSSVTVGADETLSCADPEGELTAVGCFIGQDGSGLTCE